MQINDNRAYAGIGSRQTPKPVLQLMMSLATALQVKGFTLRSGGAMGADSAFESGCQIKEIFLPWNNFQGKTMLYPIPTEAYEIAAYTHPYFHDLNPPVQKLMARNIMQILGPELNTPSLFVLCWTPDGVENGLMTTQATGGTGQAIRAATNFNIPVINIKAMPNIRSYQDVLTRIDKVLEQQNLL